MPRHTTLSPWFLVQALSKLSLAFFAAYAVNAEKSQRYENDSISALVLADGGMQAYEMPVVIPEAHGLNWNESASLVLEGESEIAASKILYDEKVMAKIKSLAAFDDFKLIRSYIPDATNPQYQTVIYDIVMDSMLHRQWNVVRGCMNLPGVDMDYRSARYNGTTYFMGWLEIGELVSVFNHTQQFNMNLSDARGRTLLHYLAITANKPHPFGPHALQLLENYLDRDNATIARKDGSGKKPLDYLSKPVAKLTEIQDKVLQAQAILKERFDTSLNILMNSFRLEDNTNSPDLMTKRKRQFHEWWLANKFFYVAAKQSFEFIMCLAAYGSYEDFKQVMAFDYLPWVGEISVVREWLLGLAGSDDDAYKKVLALHRWNREHIEGNIFAQVSSSGLTPIRYALEKLDLEAKVRPFKELQGAIKNYIGLHHLGVINIQAELNTDKPLEEIFASKESLQQALYAKVKRIKYKRPFRYNNEATQQALKNYQMSFANKYMSEVDGLGIMHRMYALQDGDMFIDLRLVQSEPEANGLKYNKNIVKDLIITASAIDFKIFVEHDLIDWSAPEFYDAVCSVILTKDASKAWVLYQFEKERSDKNIFYHVYPNGNTPIEQILSFPKMDFRYPSLNYLDELKVLGVIDLEHDIKVDLNLRKRIAVTDDIDLIKHYLPKPSDPDYNSVVHSLFRVALSNNKWTIAEALLELPAVDINYQPGEDTGATYLMYLIYYKKYDFVGKLLKNKKINVYSTDINGNTVAHYFFKTMTVDHLETPEAIALLKQLFDKSYLLSRSNYWGEQATLLYDHKLTEILGASYKEAKQSFAAAQLDFLVDMKVLYPKVEEINIDTVDKDSQLAIIKFKEHYLTAVEIGISYTRDVKYVKKFMDCSSLEEFKTFLYYDMIPWHKPEYADIREHLLADVGNKESSAKVRLLHKWGKAHLKDTVLFDITNQDVAPIRSIMLKMAKTSSAKIKANIVPFIALHYEGIININAGLKANKTVEEIFASGDSFDEVLSQLVETSSYNSIMLFANIAAVPMLALAYYLRTRRLARRANPEAPREVIVSAEEIARTERVAQCKTQLAEWRLQLQASQDKASEIKANIARVEESIASSGRAEQRELYTIACESQSAYLAMQQAYTEKGREIIGLLEAAIANPALAQSEALNLRIAEAATIKGQLSEQAHKAQEDLATAENNRIDYERAERERQQAEEAMRLREQTELERKRKSDKHAAKLREDKLQTQYFSEIMAELTDIQSFDMPPINKVDQLKQALSKVEAVKIDEAVKSAKLAPFISTIRDLERNINKLKAECKAIADSALANAHDTDISVMLRLAKLQQAKQKAIELGLSEFEIREICHRLVAVIELVKIEHQSYINDIEVAVSMMNVLAENSLLSFEAKDHEASEITNKVSLAYSQLQRKEDAKLQEIRAQYEYIHAEYEEELASRAKSRCTVVKKLTQEKPIRTAVGYDSTFSNIADKCQRIKAELDSSEVVKQLPFGVGIKSYLDRHQAMAISYNLAKLFEQLSEFIPLCRKLRNHILHRHYEAQANLAALYDLANYFIDDKRVLTMLESFIAGTDFTLKIEIKSSAYYKTYCQEKGVNYSDDLRPIEAGRKFPEIVEIEIKQAFADLSEFMKQASQSDKPLELFADSHGMLTDCVRMQINVLRDHYLGKYKPQIQAYFTDLGITNHELSRINALFHINLAPARNRDMHTSDIDAEGGMEGLIVNLDGHRIKQAYQCLANVIKLVCAMPASISLKAVTNTAPFAGAGQAASTLRADAKEFVPSFL